MFGTLGQAVRPNTKHIRNNIVVAIFVVRISEINNNHFFRPRRSCGNRCILSALPRPSECGYGAIRGRYFPSHQRNIILEYAAWPTCGDSRSYGIVVLGACCLGVVCDEYHNQIAFAVAINGCQSGWHMACVWGVLTAARVFWSIPCSYWDNSRC